ncbi:outer membrane biogenesis protein BamB [Anatilimnocola aggregata]|uniref:Outer membrane biogenesis protein BamB n=1 Tax=Anatilimnocola aggregata TaxID=2528021 RepID=A0A517YL83_9BACT|nr:PQQ-binding-like beta-propeller repeat protein [Anatilimnocola aggregata]QDU30960.1 outer membrane biogenesis protein BamB [Anatilimnocola aggregata]
MSRIATFCCVAILACCCLQLHGQDADAGKNWPAWRGPQANGVAPHGDPPTKWSETENIRWKVEIPGEGSSTPIIWGDRIFLLTAVKTDKTVDTVPDAADQPKRPFGITFPKNFYQFTVMCLDRKTGKTLWQKVATERVPHEGVHPDNDFASSSPVTDGKRLFVSFGSRGVYSYDLDGNLNWQKEFGTLSTRNSFGEGSSPALHGNILVTTWDQDGPSFIIAQNADTGELLWRKDRDEKTAWATPLIVERAGHTQVITNATNLVRSYDLKNGEVLWQCAGQVTNVTPSPVATENLVYCMSGYRGSALYALPFDQKGDLTDSDKIAWRLDRGTPYIPSPLLYDGRLYFTQSNEGILSCVDAATGKTLIERTRLPGISQAYASPVGAAGKVYFTSRRGVFLVIKHADELEVLAENKLDDDFDASPAIAGKELYLRGKKFLYCVSE